MNTQSSPPLDPEGIEDLDILNSAPEITYVIADKLWLTLSLEEINKTCEGLAEVGLFNPPCPHFTVKISDLAFGQDIKTDGWSPEALALHQQRLAAQEADWYRHESFEEWSFLPHSYGHAVLERIKHPSKHLVDAEKDRLLTEYKMDDQNRIKNLPIKITGADYWWEDRWLCIRRHMLATDNAAIFPKANSDRQANNIYNALITLLATRNVEKVERGLKSNLRKFGVEIPRSSSDPLPTSREIYLHCPAPEIEPSENGGHHQSPRFAFLRHGHLRDQHHGPGNSLVKRIWIAPVIVMADKPFVPTTITLH